MNYMQKFSSNYGRWIHFCKDLLNWLGSFRNMTILPYNSMEY